MDPLEGGMDLQHGSFLPKMYAKMKEWGPMGAMRRAHPLDPPMDRTVISYPGTDWWVRHTDIQ